MSTVHLLLIALVVVIGMMAIWFVLNQQKKAERARALSVMSGGRIQEGSGKGGKKGEADRRRADISKTLKDAAKEKDKERGKVTIQDLINMAGLRIDKKTYWIYSCVSMAVFGGLAFMWKVPMVAMVLLPFIGLLGFPRLVLKILAGKRQKRFLEEFADALEAMVRLLKAGMPPSEAIAMVAREYEGPVGDEMGQIYDAQRVGIPLAEAALDASKRMPITEMKMFATGMAIQQQTGSSLSEVLMNLSGVLRARHRLKRKVDALSAEAKASAMIIGALPLLVATGMYFVNPAYIELLWTTSKGERLLYGSIFWMSLGVLVMRQMINFKV